MKKILILIILVLTGGQLFSAGFGPYNGIITGINLLPSFSVTTSSPITSTFDFIAGIPTIQNSDLWVNLSSISFGSEFTWNSAWIMPRYDLGSLSILPYNVIAIQLAYPLNVSLQYHTELSIVSEVFSIEANIIGNLYQTLSLSTIIVPVLYLTKLASLPVAIYLELDTSFGNFSSIENSLIAGLYIMFSGNFGLNIGYNFGTTSIVGWLSIAF
ncbi:MAG: hypothetical protein ACK4F9_03045 [Brevinematia bacterium]